VAQDYRSTHLFVYIDTKEYKEHAERYLGKTTLETSGEDVEKHSKRVGKMWKNTRNEWGGSNVGVLYRL
jgi:hypothetical protein